MSLIDGHDVMRALRLADASWTNEAQRVKCASCGRRRLVYCYECGVPVDDDARRRLPRVRLPLALCVLHHPAEKKSKSSAVHATVLCDDASDVRFVEYTDDELQSLTLDDGTWLLCVDDAARSLDALPRRALLAMRRLLVLDSTWAKARGIAAHERLRALPRVRLRRYSTTFWRYQSVPDDCLATIEAIYYFFREYHVRLLATERSDSEGGASADAIEGGASADGNDESAAAAAAVVDDYARGYDGRYDNLLFLYKRQLDTIKASVRSKRKNEEEAQAEQTAERDSKLPAHVKRAALKE